jgi:arylsulfatase A-like enzyme
VHSEELLLVAKQSSRNILLLLTYLHLGRAIIFLNTEHLEHVWGIAFSWATSIFAYHTIAIFFYFSYKTKNTLLGLFLLISVLLGLIFDIHWLLFSCPINYQQLMRFFKFIVLFLLTGNISDTIWTLNEHITLLISMSIMCLLAYVSVPTYNQNINQNPLLTNTLFAIFAMFICITTYKYSPTSIYDTKIGLISSALENYNLQNTPTSKYIPLKKLLGENLSTYNQTKDSNSRKPNILLLVYESIGAQFLSTFSSYDYAVQTPNLSLLASTSLKATNHYSVSGGASINCDWAIMTGLYPLSVGKSPVSNVHLLSEKNVFSYLKSIGYRTGTFLDEYNQPWEHYKLVENNAVDFSYDYEMPEILKLKNEGERFQTLNALLQEIDKDSSTPFLFYFRTYAAHYPYQVPPQVNSPDDFERYRYLIHENDVLLGKIIAALKERKIFDSTVLLVTGDHGETFKHMHGISIHSNHTYEELTRVPFVLSYPPLLPKPKVISSLTSHVDILPTLLSIVESYTEEIGELDGYDLFTTKVNNRSTFMTNGIEGYIQTIRYKNYKFVYSQKEGYRLFDIQLDPTESNDISNENPLVMQMLLEKLRSWQLQRRRGIGDNRKLQNVQTAVARRTRDRYGRFVDNSAQNN